MKKVIYSILTLGFLVSCSSGGSDNPEPLSEQLIIGTWELSSFTSDYEIYTLEDTVKTIILDSILFFDKNDWIDVNGTLPVWRFDQNGRVYNSEDEIGLYELNGSNYQLEDSTGIYTGEFSIDSERLIFYNFGGEQLEYDSINEWWESQYLDITFNKVDISSNRSTESHTNIEEFISKSLRKSRH